MRWQPSGKSDFPTEQNRPVVFALLQSDDPQAQLVGFANVPFTCKQVGMACKEHMPPRPFAAALQKVPTFSSQMAVGPHTHEPLLPLTRTSLLATNPFV
jgi:hypothetical protein